MLNNVLPQGLPLQAEVAAQTDYDPTILAAVFRTSVLQGQILCLLLRNTLTSGQELEDHIRLTPEGRRTTIFRLRKALQAHRVSIISHPGLGYWVSPEDRERIAKLVACFKGQNR